jgi:hypothetical protein
MGMAKALQESGREEVVSFVKKGGGYVGICAGAYLGTANSTSYLSLVNAVIPDSNNWGRGGGDVQLELTDEGAELFGRREGQFPVRYHNGPVFAPGSIPDLPAYKVLAYFRTEFTRRGAKEGVMLNSPAIICAPFWRGRAMLISPHPESSTDESLRSFIHSAAYWVADRRKK